MMKSAENGGPARGPLEASWARWLTDRDVGLVRFRRTIWSSLSPEALWYELERSFTLSESSEIWPNGLMSVASDGIDQGAEIEATYKMLVMRATVHYRVEELVPRRLIAYRSCPDHIFRCGGRIELAPSGSGSLMSWSGRYTYQPVDMAAAAWFRFFFRPRFFRILEGKLRRLERSARAVHRYRREEARIR